MPANTLKSGLGLEQKRSITGWTFLLPASLMILWMNFYPMIKALLLSFQTGVGKNMRWADFYNYERLLQDVVFKKALSNTFFYLIVQVPLMLFFALILAVMLNERKLKYRGLFRTAIFLPCATSLVSYSVIFRSLFAADGFLNSILTQAGILDAPFNWLGNPTAARIVIVIALLWRWTGYNMVFYLAALQNIDPAIYEAAKIDGAGPIRQFFQITIPQLKPMILLTAILSTNGTLQLFDESYNLTRGGPAEATITLSHHIYKISFEYSPNFGYAAALSYVIFLLVAVLALIQMKAGDKR